MTDIEIARSTPLLPIAEVAQQIGIDAEQLEQYGKHLVSTISANVLLLRFVSLLSDLVLV